MAESMSKGGPGVDTCTVGGQIQTSMCEKNVSKKGDAPSTHSYKGITGSAPKGQNIMGPGTEHNDSRKY